MVIFSYNNSAVTTIGIWIIAKRFVLLWLRTEQDQQRDGFLFNFFYLKQLKIYHKPKKFTKQITITLVVSYENLNQNKTPKNSQGITYKI